MNFFRKKGRPISFGGSKSGNYTVNNGTKESGITTLKVNFFNDDDVPAYNKNVQFTSFKDDIGTKNADPRFTRNSENRFSGSYTVNVDSDSNSTSSASTVDNNARIRKNRHSVPSRAKSTPARYL